MDRTAGILMPITALPSRHGIGALGRAAYEFCDFLHKAGQKRWQVLPLGPTGFGNSPYQAFSAFAGSPYLIDLDCLAEEKLLTRAECAAAELPAGDICYDKICNGRLRLLEKAARRFDFSCAQYKDFCEANSFWLCDYARFMCLKDCNGQKPHWLWQKRDCCDECGESFYKFLQYEFFKQYGAVKKYANSLGILIIGDAPIYVSPDSSDCCFDPSLFVLSEDRRPAMLAGCPPDAFSATGQLWGNPVYDYRNNRKAVFDWWIRRLSFYGTLFDITRIDHFRGFESYYAIPAGAQSAAEGRWIKGPGKQLIKAIKAELPQLSVIAEDLGHLTPEVQALLDESGYPGMKVLQFAFDGNTQNPYLPHNHIRNCVVYTGTHDNSTLAGFEQNAPSNVTRFAREYLGVKKGGSLSCALISAALASVADTAIIPMQDYLAKNDEARINTPSKPCGNWEWRLKPGELSAETAEKIARMCSLYGR